MSGGNLVLGIDTSNYKTSVAICSMDGRILADNRSFLEVKKGERGLRQSDALFQHVEKLPKLITETFSEIRGEDICAVTASSRPRPVEGSYMPCFLAGVSAGKSLAAALGVPFYETSHQEGHIAAVTAGLSEVPEKFLAFHMSGGTCELLQVDTLSGGYHIEIIGGSKDISYGQLVDRVGVAMGYGFPAGEYLDKLAGENTAKYTKRFKPIKIDGSYINLSGIETAALRLIETNSGQTVENENIKDKIIRNENIKDKIIRNENIKAEIAAEIFDKIADSLVAIIVNGAAATGLNTAVLVGGVASSRYIRQRTDSLIKKIHAKSNKSIGGKTYGHTNDKVNLKSDNQGTEDMRGNLKGESNLKIVFGDPGLSSDNAVGTALIGGKIYGGESR